MAANDRPVLVAQLGRMQDAVRPRELADVVEQAREVDHFLLRLIAAQLDRHRLGVLCHRGAVARGGRIAQPEALHERRRHGPLEAGELSRAPVQLLGAALGAHE